MNNKDVVNSWQAGVDAKTRHLFAENGILYSYGYHYPLAVRSARHVGYTYINRTRYSMTTSQHRTLVCAEAAIGITTSMMNRVLENRGSGKPEPELREFLGELPERLSRALSDRGLQLAPDWLHIVFGGQMLTALWDINKSGPQLFITHNGNIIGRFQPKYTKPWWKPMRIIQEDI